MTFVDLQTAVAANHPMCARVEWRNGIGHAVVLTAYQILAGGARVLVQDPWPAANTLEAQQVYCSFDVFLTSYRRSGHCTDSYWTQA
jgi:hypothetical protein